MIDILRLGLQVNTSANVARKCACLTAQFAFFARADSGWLLRAHYVLLHDDTFSVNVSAKNVERIQAAPFLDTPTPSMTCTGYSRMRTKHLLPASSPGMSWRFWSCPSCQACGFQATRSAEAVHPPLTPLMCPCQELWLGACGLR